MDPALAEFERSRREYINTMKRIRLENPDITPAELEMRAREEVMKKGPKSRAYYRMQASRKLAGKEDMNKKLKDQLAQEAEANKAAEDEGKEVEEEKKADGVMRIMFDPPHYTVMENVGQFEVLTTTCDAFWQKNIAAPKKKSHSQNRYLLPFDKNISESNIERFSG